jgi:HD-GYP domain-containing protein (c-di-GMP phosphodiesterase class II)
MRFLKAEALEPGMILGRDIVSPGQSFMLKKGVKLTREYVDYLNRKGYLGAYITEEENLDVEIEEPLSLDTLSNSVKAVSEANISELMSSARHIVKDISNLKTLSIDLLDLRSFDEYTYRHSVNVAVYSVAIAKYMHLTDEELEQVALAGVCHDLGKQKIAAEIINKPGSLTDEEFNEIKSHPKYSYEMLQDNHDISPVVRQAVLCHHENENGSGFLPERPEKN